VNAAHDEERGDDADCQPTPHENSPQSRNEEKGKKDQRDPELEIAGQRQRREDGDEHSAERAAERDHQVIAREVQRVGLEPRQLAMAEHAGDEQADQVQRHRDVEFERGHVERHRRQQRDQYHDEQRPHVPARVIEREDEAAEVEREGQHPQERYARNVLRDVVGDRQQHHRAHRGQREPLQLRRHGKRRGARRGRDLVGPEAVHRQPRGERAEDDEAGKHEGPHPA